MTQCKARFIVQGFLQIYGISFYKTFSPMVKRELLRIFLAISCLLGLSMDQVDIVSAYLKSLLMENDLSIFIKLPSRMKSFRAIKERLVVYLL